MRAHRPSNLFNNPNGFSYSLVIKDWARVASADHMGAFAIGQTLVDLYMEHMIPALLSRASHPVVVGKSVADSLDLLGIEGAEAWSDGAIMRYRSRRTLIDIIGNPEFYARHDFKLAGLEKTIAYPVEPRIYVGDLRLLLGLFMLAITALLDARLARKEPRADSR